MSRRRNLSLAATVALLLSALAVPRSAAGAGELASRVVLTDPTGDVWVIGEGEDEDWASAGDEPAIDVLRAVVRHGRRNLVVKMTFVNLRRVEPQFYSAMIVTSEHYGAVFVSAQPGRWRGRHKLVDEQFAGVKCPGLSHSIDYDTERVLIHIPRSCIGEPPWLKVGMANYVFRGATDDDFQELTDNPHSTGHGRQSLTRRIY